MKNKADEFHEQCKVQRKTLDGLLTKVCWLPAIFVRKNTEILILRKGSHKQTEFIFDRWIIVEVWDMVNEAELDAADISNCLDEKWITLK